MSARLMALALMAAWIAGPDLARADVRLAPCFTSHMVIQRDAPARLVGWADAGESVVVRLGQDVVGKATGKGHDKDACWTVVLPARKAGPIPDISIEGKNTITLTNLLAGEVWVCSGQSNMRMTVAKGPWCGYGGVADAEQEVAAAADYPAIRLNPGAGWQVCTPESVKSFSAAGYFFGRELYKRLNVPIGLAEGSQGATPAEAWTPPEAIPGFSAEWERARGVQQELKALGDADRQAFAQWAKDVQEARTAGRPAPPRPKEKLSSEQKQRLEAAELVLGTGSCYRNRIARFVPMVIRGVIWYQGESNRPRADQYAGLVTAMMGAWRKEWGSDFPFLVMQLVNFGEGPGRPQTGFAELREAQQQVADTVPSTGLAVGIDLGLPKEIHPPDKQEVGRRLALVALRQVYGHDVVASGPRLKEARFERDRVILSFDPGGKDQQLVLRAADPNGFELAGADGTFVPAAAQLQENRITLTAPSVGPPRAVRYAWYDNPPVSLFNTAGLPAPPFRRMAPGGDKTE